MTEAELPKGQTTKDGESETQQKAIEKREESREKRTRRGKQQVGKCRGDGAESRRGEGGAPRAPVAERRADARGDPHGGTGRRPAETGRRGGPDRNPERRAQGGRPSDTRVGGGREAASAATPARPAPGTPTARPGGERWGRPAGGEKGKEAEVPGGRGARAGSGEGRRGGGLRKNAPTSCPARAGSGSRDAGPGSPSPTSGAPPAASPRGHQVRGPRPRPAPPRGRSGRWGEDAGLGRGRPRRDLPGPPHAPRACGRPPGLSFPICERGEGRRANSCRVPVRGAGGEASQSPAEDRDLSLCTGGETEARGQDRPVPGRTRRETEWNWDSNSQVLNAERRPPAPLAVLWPLAGNNDS